jgi:AraC-like DNA-binding protein
LLKPRSSVSAGLDAAGDWAIRVSPYAGTKFNAVTRGACWVSVDGAGPPIRLESGDCFLMPHGRPFTIGSDLSLAPVDARTVYDAAENGIATCNGGGEVFLVSGRFDFAGEPAAALLGTLPPVVHVREASDQASVLRWALDRLAAEMRARRPGGDLVAEHLAQIMLVQVLRLYLASRDTAGWFAALSDRQLSTVLGALHADPARRWTLDELARHAGMSRSSFAERFKRIVGAAPMEYLAQWRMLVAGDRLRHGAETVSAIALSLGYESESAFSTAFKRLMSCSPRQYRHREPAK